MPVSGEDDKPLPDIPNDPAGRLHDLLSEMRTHSREMNTGPALAATLGVEWPEGYPDVALAISSIVRLPAQVRAQIASPADEDHELLLEHVPSIDAALAQLQNLNVPVQNVQQGIRDDALYSLRLCSSALRRKLPERKLAGEDVKDLQQGTSELLEAVIASSLTDSTKRLIGHHIAAIIRALTLARVEGIAGVEAAFDETVGALKRRPDIADELIRESRKPGTAAHRFWTWMGRLATVVTVAGGMLQIEGSAAAPDEPPARVTINVDQSHHFEITYDEPWALPGPSHPRDSTTSQLGESEQR